MTGSFDGTIKIWKNSAKVHETQELRNGNRPVMTCKFGRIFATCKEKDILEMNANLNTVHSFDSLEPVLIPQLIDVSRNHIAVAYSYAHGNAFNDGGVIIYVTERTYDELVEPNKQVLSGISTC